MNIERAKRNKEIIGRYSYYLLIDGVWYQFYFKGDTSCWRLEFASMFGINAYEDIDIKYALENIYEIEGQTWPDLSRYRPPS